MLHNKKEIIMHKTNESSKTDTVELHIDDLFVGMEVVSEVKLGYCSPL